MTPPIDPVEREGVEKDAALVQRNLIRDPTKPPSQDPSAALDRILAENKRLEQESDNWQSATAEAIRQLTLEKQRGDGLRAFVAHFIEWYENADDPSDEALVDEANRLGDEAYALQNSDQAESSDLQNREALRISQGDSK